MVGYLCGDLEFHDMGLGSEAGLLPAGMLLLRQAQSRGTLQSLLPHKQGQPAGGPLCPIGHQ